MRLAYIAFLRDASQETGISKKIVDQIRAWTSLGHDVRLFILTTGSRHAWHGFDHVGFEIVANLKPWNLFRKGQLHAQQVVSWQPDTVYARCDFYYPGWTTIVARYPVVVEVNTDDLAERALKAKSSINHKLRAAYVRANRARFLADVDGFVCVTHEIGSLYAKFGKPWYVCGNPIDLSRFPVTPPYEATRPSLIFIGSPRYAWNGEDKIVALASRFPNWDIHVVGYGETDLPQSFPTNLFPHGFLTSHAYEDLVTRADVAIGTLSLHVKNMNEASPLKVREYLARGIPTIIGYRDTDFPHTVPFLLELPNTPGNVVDNLERIDEFVRQFRGKRVPRSDIAHLDAKTKGAAVIAFLEELGKRRNDEL